MMYVSSKRETVNHLLRARCTACCGLCCGQIPAKTLAIPPLLRCCGCAGGGKVVAARRKNFSLLVACPEKDIDGAALLDEYTATLNRHLVLQPGRAEMIALWWLYSHTYLSPVFTHNPRLLLRSPVANCGKTIAVGMLKQSMQCPLMSSNISGSSIYRSIEECNCALLIDEADTQFPNNPDVRGILNSGQDRDGAVVVRQEKDKKGEFHTREFSTWTPMVVGWNEEKAKVPRTFYTRCLDVPMRRKRPGEGAQRLRPDDIGHLHAMGRRAVRWSQEHIQTLTDDPDMTGLDNRDADNWRPLYIIAEAAGGHWPQTVRKVAAIVTGGAPKHQEIGVQLLADCRHIFRACDRMHSETLCSKLVELEDRPWKAYNSRGRDPFITQSQIADLLEPFDIHPKGMRIGPLNKRGYELAQFREALECYLPPDAYPPSQGATAATASNSAGFEADEGATEGATRPATGGQQQMEDAVGAAT